MRSDVERLLATGMGAVLLTREKIEEIVRSRMEDSRLSREEAENLVEELYRSGEQQWSGLRAIARRVLEDTRSALNLGSEQTVEELIDRVSRLEKRMAVVEDLCRRQKDRIEGVLRESDDSGKSSQQ